MTLVQELMNIEPPTWSVLIGADPIGGALRSAFPLPDPTPAELLEPLDDLHAAKKLTERRSHNASGIDRYRHRQALRPPKR
jgi:hypothetical protein